MTALTIAAPGPLWAGRCVVRAAGRRELHVAVEGAALPVAVMFTVPVECRPDAESAPGVRPWTGPVDEDRLCAGCLRALGAPAADRPVTTAAGEPPADRGQARDHRRQAVPGLSQSSGPGRLVQYGGRPGQWPQ
ncbi:hypothetical protein [Streptomyces sp. NPDC020965]|uniref:hypothetical protein n=1 Tax=Streptomyces sp. NPDC020965 TaxID=3365105 RepID=UPI0037A4AA9A